LEKDAEFANRHGFSKRHPALPLYTRHDAEVSLNRLTTVPFGAWFQPNSAMRVEFLPAGHILGAAIIRMVLDGRTIVFSGDLGRPNSATMLDPTAVNASEIFCAHGEDHKLSPAQCRAASEIAHYVRDVGESKALDTSFIPKVIISASGMATGGGSFIT
jgi:predicted metal-dependent RNase